MSGRVNVCQYPKILKPSSADRVTVIEMGWKYSTVLNVAGIACIAISERLLENPDTRIYGVVFGAVGAGCVAAANYLAQQGYGMKTRK